MDIRIRKNENCIIGLPRCGYVFSATRSCFVAYGYKDSPLEKDILCDLLQSKGIEPIVASGSLAPAQSAFCAKICSKIIGSQFCVVLINNDKVGKNEIPNANVNMEYGLMLGFNKLVIPFQRSEQKLPFNVAGLDTIKYDKESFKEKASKAIDEAIIATSDNRNEVVDTNRDIETFLISKRMLLCPLLNDGEKNLYHLGSPLGFLLLNDFSGLDVVYFGMFTAFSPDNVAWRLLQLFDILESRLSNLDFKLQTGLITQQQKEVAEMLFEKYRIWALVNTDSDRTSVLGLLQNSWVMQKCKIFTLQEVQESMLKMQL